MKNLVADATIDNPYTTHDTSVIHFKKATQAQYEAAQSDFTSDNIIQSNPNNLFLHRS